MIPSSLSPEVKSTAERRIFEWFKNAPQTEEWVVLHSLGIANHLRLIHGEVDFFVIVPNKGIFALEVKGGRVARRDGVWCFTNKYNKTTTKNRGPFEQAWEGIHSIAADIKAKTDFLHKHINDTFFGIGVMFPDIEYIVSGCDEEQWQVFDCRDGSNVKAFIDRLFVNSCKKWKEKYGNHSLDNRFPTKYDVKYIVSLLRGDFDKIISLSVQIKLAEEQLLTLTDEQYRCLDQLEDNSRCLIRGGAGTGKTLLALEEAKRAALAGQKVGFFCFNKNLGEWLEKCCELFSSEFKVHYVGTLHKYMLQLIGNDVCVPSEINAQNHFFSHELPNRLLEYLRDKSALFDKIIVDEMQDLFSDEYLLVFDSLLINGMDRGKWTFFGDFSSQAIYQNRVDEQYVFDRLDEFGSFTRCKLTTNCRNTKAIFEEIVTVTGYNALTNIWNKVDGPPVNYVTYETTDDQKEQLEKILENLLENNIPPHAITILSPFRREKSVAAELKQTEIIDFKIGSLDKISFSTIHSYKGLENTIIILTDIETFAHQQLMYVALSRARSGLFILEAKAASFEYLEFQKRRFLE